MVQTAFKEWAVVVEALGSGKQIVILRKGGIAEGTGGFKAEHDRFWLFPTQFHQQRQGVVESASRAFEEIEFPAEGILKIEFAAEVVEACRLGSLEQANQLKGQHIWRDEVIADRFDWGRDSGIYAMAVRSRRLLKPLELPMLESYSGCKSWIELETPIDFSSTQPVLDDMSFAAKLRDFREVLV